MLIIEAQIFNSWANWQEKKLKKYHAWITLKHESPTRRVLFHGLTKLVALPFPLTRSYFFALKLLSGKQKSHQDFPHSQLQNPRSNGSSLGEPALLSGIFPAISSITIHRLDSVRFVSCASVRNRIFPITARKRFSRDMTTLAAYLWVVLVTP